MSELRDHFVASFGEFLAVSIEAAVESHLPELRVALERGSDHFRFALIWAIGLECISSPVYRDAHGITVPWELVRGWCAAANLLDEFDGTFDWGGLAAGRFDGILEPATVAQVELGHEAAIGWLLGSTTAATRPD